MATSALISLLIALLVLVVVVAVIMYIIDLIGLGQPWNKIAKLIIALIAFLWLLKLLVPFAGL